MKICSDCKQKKALSEFYKYRRAGRETYYARCKPCQLIRLKNTVPEDVKRKRRQEHRARTIEKVNALKSGPCVDCKVAYPPYVMDFDHVRGDKVVNIAKMVARSSWQEIVDEIAKCELVCSNCHRERTHKRLD